MEYEVINETHGPHGTHESHGTHGTRETRNQVGEYQCLLKQSECDFSYGSNRPRNMLYYSYQGRDSRFFIPFLMCFLPFINSIMLIFVLYAINSINQTASILTNSNVTNTVTKIEHIIDYLCESKIVSC